MNLAEAELLAWLRLARLPGLDAARIRELQAGGDDPGALLARLDPGKQAAATPADLAWLAQPGHHLLTACDPRYPPQLAAAPGAPVALFVAGDPAILSLPAIAVVGSRRPTPQGRETARAFAARFARAGLVVTSGLATGIDAAAHRGALDGDGPTIAVCGTGLDLVYPPRHASLAAEIAARGALVSELPPGTPPRPWHFPRRNRVISGLSLGVLVAEAAQRSGSLITARLAGEQGREVFAVPGSIHSPLSRGCHRLIRDGAQLVESADEVLAGLQHDLFAAVAPPASSSGGASGVPAVELDSDCKILLNACGFGPVDADILVERTGFPAAVVSSKLLLLELAGAIEPCAGGRYCRVPTRSCG